MTPPKQPNVFVKNFTVIKVAIIMLIGIVIAIVLMVPRHELYNTLVVDRPRTATFTIALAILPLLIACIGSVVVVIVDRNRRRQLEFVERKAELISAIAHELISPLAGIRWGAEGLTHMSHEENTKKLASAMYKSANRLQENIDDVLSLARLGSEGQKLNSCPTDMVRLIQEVFATQQLAADEKRVQLAWAPDWPAQLIITCDATRMKRVLNSLVSNAIKYTRDGTVVRVACVLTPDFQRIMVSDEGIGIPQAEQEKVFSGFYRAQNAIKSGRPGTGMGLYLARATVEQHGGTLWLQSAEDKGTTVGMDFPVVKNEAKRR